MPLNTRYVTADEFKAYTGIDLENELQSTSNPSDAVNAFIWRTAENLEAWLETNYHKRVEVLYPQFTDWQKEQYKLALMEQMLYILKDGDHSVDSGYDPEKGIIAQHGKVSALLVGDSAKMHLQLAGLLDRKLRTKGNMGYFNGEWWY